MLPLYTLILLVSFVQMYCVPRTSYEGPRTSTRYHVRLREALHWKKCHAVWCTYMYSTWSVAFCATAVTKRISTSRRGSILCTRTYLYTVRAYCGNTRAARTFVVLSLAPTENITKCMRDSAQQKRREFAHTNL